MNKLKRDYPEKYEELINAISDTSGVDVEEIKVAKNLKNDLAFDSLDEVETIMEAEKVFDISIPDDEAGALNGDIEKLCDAVWEKLQ